MPVEDESFEGVKTKKKHKHVPSSFAYLIKCSFDESLDHFELYRGDQCAKRFTEGLTAKIKDLYETHVFNKYANVIMNEEDRRTFKNCTICHICKKAIETVSDKVVDHCHLTGKET